MDIDAIPCAARPFSPPFSHATLRVRIGSDTRYLVEDFIVTPARRELSFAWRAGTDSVSAAFAVTIQYVLSTVFRKIDIRSAAIMHQHLRLTDVVRIDASNFEVIGRLNDSRVVHASDDSSRPIFREQLAADVKVSDFEPAVSGTK